MDTPKIVSDVPARTCQMKKRLVVIDLTQLLVVKTFDSLSACAKDFKVALSSISDDIKFARVRDNSMFKYDNDLVVGDIVTDVPTRGAEWPILPLGVHYFGRKDRPVRAMIKYKNADIDLGKYNDINEAAQVYAIAAKMTKSLRGSDKVADLSITNLLNKLKVDDGITIKSHVARK